MAEAKSLRERRFYPVLFMIIITVIFVGLLATFYQLTRERVETHRQMVLKTTILQLFELPTVDLQSTYDAYIQEKCWMDVHTTQLWMAIPLSAIACQYPVAGCGALFTLWWLYHLSWIASGK